MSDHLSMKQENLEMEELEEISMRHIVIKQEPQVFVNVSEIRDPDLDIENFKEESSHPENQIDISEQVSNATDNDNLADIEEDKPLKRKKLTKKTGNDNVPDIKEDKPLKRKKLKNKSMEFSNETSKGGLIPEKPFSCHQCHMTFHQKGHLRNHEIHKHKSPANKNFDVSGQSSEITMENLPEPPAGLVEKYYDLDLSVEFLSQLFTYVNELCEFINNGDQNIDRTSVVIQNLNEAVSCYQDHLPLIDPTDAIKGQEDFKYEMVPPDFLENDEDYNPKKKVVNENIGEKGEKKKTGEKRGKYKTAEKSEICNMCNKAFAKKHKLKIHIDIVHNNLEPFLCPQCGSGFTHKRKLRIHVEKIHEGNIPNHICSTCGKNFTSSSILNRHIESVHEKVVRFKCFLCDAGFYDKGNLTHHMGSVHEGKRPHSCPFCESGFSRKSDLKQHIESVHEGKKPFKCDECDSSFSMKANLEKHVDQVHKKVRNFMCTLCSRYFFAKSDLERHIATVHEKKKPHKCALCDDSFSVKYHVKTHIRRVHEGIKRTPCLKPFFCPICSGSFSLNAKLKKHMVSAHNLKAEMKY